MKFTEVRTLCTLRCITGELLQQAKLLTLIRSKTDGETSVKYAVYFLWQD